MEALDVEGNALFDLIGCQGDIDKTYLCAQELYETKYQLLTNKRKVVVLKEYSDSKAFIEYSNQMDIYENAEEYHTDKKRKILIIFNDMILDMLSKKKPNPIITE